MNVGGRGLVKALEIRGMCERDVLMVSRRKPNGLYGFPGDWTERELGLASTARNWSTVTKIVASCAAGDS